LLSTIPTPFKAVSNIEDFVILVTIGITLSGNEAVDIVLKSSLQ